MKKKYALLLVSLFATLCFTSSLVSVKGLGYEIDPNDYFYYECKFNKYALDDILNEVEDYPVNTTLVKLRAIEAFTNTSTTQVYGTLREKLWFLPVGEKENNIYTELGDWELENDNLLYYLDSNNIETYGSVGFLEGGVTKDSIIDFFESSPHVIPTGLSDENWTSIKNRLEGNLQAGYGYVKTYQGQRSGNTITVENLGPNPDTIENYTLEITYNAQGQLQEYNLYRPYSVIEDMVRVDKQYYVFNAKLISEDVIFNPESASQNSWIPYAIGGGILVVVAAVILFLLKRHKSS